MAQRGGYGQFCPVSMASEIVCARWTMLVLRELLCGTTRFNDLRRGLPRMSPALLSKRLKELEKAGIVSASAAGRGHAAEYRLTAAGEDLRGVVMSIGNWGQRWVESKVSLRNLDPSLLMWDMHRWLRPEPLPPGRCTIQFQYSELKEDRRNYWLVVEGGTVDVCQDDPGFEVDLLVRVPLRNMTAIWMGLSSVATEVASGHMKLDGDPRIAKAMQQWLGLSPFASVPRSVA